MTDRRRIISGGECCNSYKKYSYFITTLSFCLKKILVQKDVCKYKGICTGCKYMVQEREILRVTTISKTLQNPLSKRS